MSIINHLLRSLAFFTLVMGTSSFAQHTPELEEELKSALTSDFNYQGTLDWGEEENGTFCKSYNRGFLDFNIYLHDVEVQIDEENTITFDLTFNQGNISFRQEYQNGALCVPTTARADILVDTIFATLKLIPSKTPKETSAKIRLPNLEILGLELKSVFIGAGKYEIGGSSPDWLNQWIEKNFNKFMASFLKTSIADRITDHFLAKLEKKLREGHGENTEEDASTSPDAVLLP